jgi:hypothetical protein
VAAVPPFVIPKFDWSVCNHFTPVAESLSVTATLLKKYDEFTMFSSLPSKK